MRRCCMGDVPNEDHGEQVLTNVGLNVCKGNREHCVQRACNGFTMMFIKTGIKHLLLSPCSEAQACHQYRQRPGSISHAQYFSTSCTGLRVFRSQAPDIRMALQVIHNTTGIDVCHQARVGLAGPREASALMSNRQGHQAPDHSPY
jgi:hypothetical protein